MPGMDGIETFEAIDEEYGADVPVVLLLGKNIDDRLANENIEPSAHLSKPSRMNEILSCVEDVLDREPM